MMKAAELQYVLCVLHIEVSRKALWRQLALVNARLDYTWLHKTWSHDMASVIHEKEHIVCILVLFLLQLLEMNPFNSEWFALNEPFQQ